MKSSFGGARPGSRAELFAPVVGRAATRSTNGASRGTGSRRGRSRSYDAYMVFGGAMHPDQEALHTWLPKEITWLEGLLADRRPTLGVCLGVQLLARAAGSPGAPPRRARRSGGSTSS